LDLKIVLNEKGVNRMTIGIELNEQGFNWMNMKIKSNEKGLNWVNIAILDIATFGLAWLALRALWCSNKDSKCGVIDYNITAKLRSKGAFKFLLTFYNLKSGKPTMESQINFFPGMFDRPIFKSSFHLPMWVE